MKAKHNRTYIGLKSDSDPKKKNNEKLIVQICQSGNQRELTVFLIQSFSEKSSLRYQFYSRSRWFLVAKRLEVLFDFRKNNKKTLSGGKNKEKFQHGRNKGGKKRFMRKSQVIGLVYGSSRKRLTTKLRDKMVLLKICPEIRENFTCVYLLSFHIILLYNFCMIIFFLFSSQLKFL